jgi:predicted ATPase
MIPKVITDKDFVGRQRELEGLWVKLASTVTGRGSLVLVAGEAGIGKTSIVQQFAEKARVGGAIVLWGACFEGEWRPSYLPRKNVIASTNL